MMQPGVSFTSANEVLRSLEPESVARLCDRLERVELAAHSTLYDPQNEITHVYFPDGALVSIVARTAAGIEADVAVIGREGAAGVQVLMRTNTSPHTYRVQIPGPAYRLPAADLITEFNRCGGAHRAILVFLNKMIIQISQTTLCNRAHGLEQRLARWLLMCFDRVHDSDLPLTQEFLSMMLGVTRPSVSIAAAPLQAAGHIEYNRGLIRILDRVALERVACECYGLVKIEYDRPPSNANL